MYVILLILLECDIEDKYVTCEYVSTHAFDYNLVYLLRAIRLFFYPYANKYCRKFYSQTISVNDLWVYEIRQFLLLLPFLGELIQEI